MNRRLRRRTPYIHALTGVLGLLLLAAQPAARAATNTWTGATGDWFDTNKWSLLAFPADGDDVWITNANASVIVSNATARLSSLTLSRTLVFTNWNSILTATEVRIASNGNMTCAGPFNDTTDMSNRVNIACTNLSIEQGGKIDVTGKGFKGGVNSGGVTVWGFGPGKGWGYGGGGYGGAAGGTSGETVGGGTYGSYLTPLAPGSGGGKLYYQAGTGGPGGGAIRINASGALLVNGQILADGGQGSGGYAGAGSGGAIYITCGTLAGTNTGSFGLVRAKGGGNSNNGGGGGRIAVECNPASQAGLPKPALVFSADRGMETGTLADRGTIYFSDSALLPSTLTNWYGYVYGVSSWSPASPWLSSSWVLFKDPIGLTPTADMNLTGSTLAFDSITNSFSVSNVTLNGSALRFGSDVSTQIAITVVGRVDLTNSSTWTIYSGPTNQTDWTSYSCLVAISNDMTIGTNSWVIPYSSPQGGGGVLFRLNNLMINSNGGFNANGTGYRPIGKTGYGPGKGLKYQGASHGGKGANPVNNNTYGNSNAPVMPGSGANSDMGVGSRGGGVVRIEAAGTMTVHGTISADGAGGDQWSGGASGGSVYLSAYLFAPYYGVISARGGGGGGQGGGGGGRIAMYYVIDNFLGTVTAAGATGTSGNGTTGTIVRALQPGYALLNIVGNPQPHGTANPDLYGVSGKTVGMVITNSVNSPADSLNGLRYECLGWAWSNALGQAGSGVATQVVFTIAADTTLTWYWTNAFQLTCSAALNGSLSVDKSGWYTNGVETTITAVAAPGYHFSQWSGTGVPAGARLDNPLTVKMNRERTVVAQFASDTPQTLTWQGTGDWFTPGNWSSGAAPGSQDTALIGSGSITLGDAIALGGLIITNGTLNIQAASLYESAMQFQVAGDTVVSGPSSVLSISNMPWQCGGNLTLQGGAALYTYAGPNWAGTNYGMLVDVAGAMVVNSNCWVYPANERMNTNSFGALFRVGSLTIATNAGFNAKGLGYWASQRTSANGLAQTGFGPGYGNRYAGGGYGGQGGYVGPNDIGGITYGSSNAPVQPGSGGGAEGYGGAGGNGGGLIRIEALGAISLSGTLDADGGVPPGTHCGCGSGGGIFLISRKLIGPAYARITAKGAGKSSSNGGGGGGRIALWNVFDNYSGTLNVDGGVGDMATGAAGTIVRGKLPMQSGTVILIR